MKKISQIGIALIKKFEGCKLTPYLCPAKIATVGWGSTYYADGRPVHIGDKPLTQAQADELLLKTLSKYEEAVNYYTKVELNQFQFDALVSFAYNLGTSALKTSTLLKKVNLNPDDKSIEQEFMKWCRAGGKVLPGLLTRRTAESKIYFS